MKIAIATDDFVNITGHVGRCRGFLIYELENGKIISKENVENTFTHHKMGVHHHHGEGHGHGGGHQGHGDLVEGLSGCSNLICQAAGWRLVDELKQNKIDVIFTNEANADTAAIKFSTGNLEIIEDGACNSH